MERCGTIKRRYSVCSKYPWTPVAWLYLPLCLVAERTSPETTAGIMDPWVLAHTGIKQGLVHTRIQVSLLNISLYRKRFHFYRKVMKTKITGLANKTFSYNDVEKEIHSLFLRMRHTVAMEEETNRWTVNKNYIYRQYLILSKTCYIYRIFHNAIIFI
jgi:hypothetical protein